jgi:uncharacterized membrane protein
MEKGRLEAFSDGVLAILITIMVLELRVPNGGDLAALKPLLPVLLSYILSFIYIGIYWNNHHHLFQVVEKVNGRILWANLHLLFWLSLVPFVTNWMGENGSSSLPTALYGMILLMAALAYSILVRALLSNHSKNSMLATAIGDDFKGNISLVFYVVAIPLAFVNEWISRALFIAVAIIWLIPDPRIERRLSKQKTKS